LETVTGAVLPITKSAKKSLKVSRTKKALNQTKRVALEKALRTADAKTVNHTVSLIDKAAKTGIIHKNKAARLKSQLAKKLGTPKREKSKERVATKTEAVKKPVVKKTKTKK